MICMILVCVSLVFFFVFIYWIVGVMIFKNFLMVFLNVMFLKFL